MISTIFNLLKYTQSVKPSLNRDGGRHRFPATYDPLLTESLALSDVTIAVVCSFLDKDWCCSVEICVSPIFVLDITV